jgi:hypothetical protein
MFDGHLAHFIAIVLFCDHFVYFTPILVNCIQKNLATLIPAKQCAPQNDLPNSRNASSNRRRKTKRKKEV